MKVCIVSDSHDHLPRLQAAVAQSINLGAREVLHCGDVVAPSTLSVLEPFGLPVHVIHGNNSGDVFMLSRLSARADSVVSYHGQDAGLTLAGRRIFLVHYPHYARALAATGDWDLVCCGHSHRASVKRQNNLSGAQTVIVNPGTVGGVGAPPTYMLGDLEAMEFAIMNVPSSQAA